MRHAVKEISCLRVFTDGYMGGGTEGGRGWSVVVVVICPLLLPPTPATLLSYHHPPTNSSSAIDQVHLVTTLKSVCISSLGR